MTVNVLIWSCSFCEWEMAVSVELLQFPIVQSAGNALIENHLAGHAAEIREGAEALIAEQ